LIYSRGHRSGTAGAVSGEVSLRGSELAHHLVDLLADRQASDVLLLDLTAISAFTDYFVVATVDNVRQMRAVSDAVSDDLARAVPDLQPREEGTFAAGWTLIDLGDVVLHLFSLEQRAYYNLEGLWSSAREVVRIQ